MFSCEINKHVYIGMYRNRVFLRDSGFFPVSRFEIRLDYFKFSSANMILIYLEGQLFTTKYIRGACALSCIYYQNIFTKEETAKTHCRAPNPEIESKPESRVPRYSVWSLSTYLWHESYDGKIFVGRDGTKTIRRDAGRDGRRPLGETRRAVPGQIFVVPSVSDRII